MEKSSATYENYSQNKDGENNSPAECICVGDNLQRRRILLKTTRDESEISNGILRRTSSQRELYRRWKSICDPTISPPLLEIKDK